MRSETYTTFRHVIGEDYSSYTPIEDVEMRIHKEATIHDMMQALKRFLICIGYSKEALDEYIEDE